MTLFMGPRRDINCEGSCTIHIYIYMSTAKPAIKTMVA